jgi:hypothetical protein
LSGSVAPIGETNVCSRELVPIPRRSRYRWVDNIKMDLREVGCR